MSTSSIFSSTLYPLLAGGTSALITTTLYQPLDFLKTQIQEPKDGLSKRSIGSITRHTIQQYSVFRLWRGLTPSLFRAVPGAALYFHFLNLYKENIPQARQTVFTNGIASAIARGVADLVIFPFTLIKTRLESSRYTKMSMWSVIQHIYTRDGLRGFYVGLLPTLARDLPFSGIYYMSYRELKEIFPLDPSSTSRTTWLTSQAGISVTAGVIASFITQPADVIKTYRQVAPSDYQNVYVIIKSIIKTDGFVGFARGFFLRAFRRTLVAATSWTIYESFLKQ